MNHIGFIVTKKVLNDVEIESIHSRETIEAMLEAERLSRDPNAKRYSNFCEAFEDVMADESV